MEEGNVEDFQGKPNPEGKQTIVYTEGKHGFWEKETDKDGNEFAKFREDPKGPRDIGHYTLLTADGQVVEMPKTTKELGPDHNCGFACIAAAKAIDQNGGKVPHNAIGRVEFGKIRSWSGRADSWFPSSDHSPESYPPKTHLPRYAE